MTNKIARGTTGQATAIDIIQNAQNGFGGWGAYGIDIQWAIGQGAIDSISVPYYSNATGGDWYPNPESSAHWVGPQGWSITPSGLITVPAGATQGLYGAYYVLSIDTVAPLTTYARYRFEVVCVAVTVKLSKLSSSPISGTNPVQYAHKYAVEAIASGGLQPYSYSWSSSVGILSASGTSGTLTVTNSEPNSGGITGTVSCAVTDSNDPECEDTGSASLEDLGDIPNDGTGPEFDPGYGPGNGPTGGPCKVCPPQAGNSSQQCGCKDEKGQTTCEGQNCPSPNGEHTEASSSTNVQRFSNYAGGGSTPTSYLRAR